MGQVTLYDAAIGETVTVGGVELEVVGASNGCAGCVFKTEAGSKLCRMTGFCFAHNRKDKQPVIFIKVK